MTLKIANFVELTFADLLIDSKFAELIFADGRELSNILSFRINGKGNSVYYLKKYV